METQITATTLEQFQKAGDMLKRIGGDIEKKATSIVASNFNTVIYLPAHSLPNSTLILPSTVAIQEVEMQDVGDGKFVYRLVLVVADTLAKGHLSATYVELRIIEMRNVGLKIHQKTT